LFFRNNQYDKDKNMKNNNIRFVFSD